MVTDRTDETDRPGSRLRGTYFYLSYAQSQPLAGARAAAEQADPDQWVRRFYRDLSDAVQRRAAPRSRLAPGAYDQEIPLGSDWKTTLAEALGHAQTFVPLYSPRYFSLAWPGREWACYLQRLENAGVHNPLQRFVPVLWTPLPWDSDEDAPRDEARLGLREAMAGAESDYAENGLRALLRLKAYRPSYEREVERLAGLIVGLAHTSPVPGSPVPDIDSTPSAFNPEASPAAFTVTVAAPSLSDLRDGQDGTSYGRNGLEWRPFPGSPELSLAGYAARIAEQMDFAVLEESIQKPGDLPSGRPGVLLIDPRFIDGERGRAVLRSLVADLRPWVLPMLVLGPAPNSRATDLAEQVRNMLGQTTGTRGDPARRAIRGVTSLADFAALMPILAAEAERQYLRHGQGERPSSPVPRPRLAGPAAPPDRAREIPDA